MSFKCNILSLFLLLYGTITSAQSINTSTLTGAYNTTAYLPLLLNKKIGVVANQTSLIGNTHLVDSFLHLKLQVTKVFGPEHGFRGTAANGEHVKNETDAKTGLPVISLYGKHREPTHEDFVGLDVIVFDLQDVGVRFYTHLTTLHHIMNRCATENIPLVVLDRPNPNGYYTDGPVLQTGFVSDVGVHPIPLVHGMTLGELAQMINGESWLKEGKKCNLTVVKCTGWNHNKKYVLPVPPSPNLSSNESIIAYPTLGLFEGIDISVGRGTEFPFVCFGAPWLTIGSYKFIPKEILGKTMNPPFENDTCFGFFISDFAKNYLIDHKKLYLEWLELLLLQYPDQSKFFNPFFDKLAGCSTLREQLLNRTPLSDIRESWTPDLEKFKEKRRPYLLYAFDENIGLTW